MGIFEVRVSVIEMISRKRAARKVTGWLRPWLMKKMEQIAAPVPAMILGAALKSYFMVLWPRNLLGRGVG